MPKSRGVCWDSLEHPHSQVMAIPLVSKDIGRKYVVATSYGNDAERCHYCEVLMDEMTLWEGVILVHRNSLLELGLYRNTINWAFANSRKKIFPIGPMCRSGCLYFLTKRCYIWIASSRFVPHRWRPTRKIAVSGTFKSFRGLLRSLDSSWDRGWASIPQYRVA